MALLLTTCAHVPGKTQLVTECNMLLCRHSELSRMCHGLDLCLATAGHKMRKADMLADALGPAQICS